MVQPLLSLADDVLLRHADVLEVLLAQFVVMPSTISIGRTVSPGVFMSSISKKLMPSCFFGPRVGAHQQEHLVGEVGAGGPDLRAVDDVVIAVEHGLGLQAREVGAGVRLGVALAPDVVRW